ncbi:unnamed protein product [Symbiodinium natans]|uniref:RRM domain-containing protein n=1 Tax=Symbiodinium natans TaxID=878477 RepID=A0A812P242_9DINO|nr:unnamed protein product [Symbiodinium natans]
MGDQLPKTLPKITRRGKKCDGNDNFRRERSRRRKGAADALSSEALPPTLVSGDADGPAQRDVYFGNLVRGMVNEEVMRNLIQPAAMQAPEYDPELGPPITKVTIIPNAAHGFVQFQSAALATWSIARFHATELFGNKMQVGRPCFSGFRAFCEKPNSKSTLLET